MILGFWELPEDEQPPDRIFGDDEALVGWFEAIKREREAKHGGGKTSGQLEEVPLASNEIDLSMF